MLHRSSNEIPRSTLFGKMTYLTLAERRWILDRVSYFLVSWTQRTAQAISSIASMALFMNAKGAMLTSTLNLSVFNRLVLTGHEFESGKAAAYSDCNSQGLERNSSFHRSQERGCIKDTCRLVFHIGVQSPERFMEALLIFSIYIALFSP